SPLARGKPRRHAALPGVARAPVTRQARRGARRRVKDPGVTAAAGAPELPLSRPRPLSLERVTSTLFFTTLFVSTFEKVHWNFGGQLGINDITTVLFLVAFLASEREREERFPRTSAVVLGFFALFALVYLAGFWDLTTKQGLTQFWKGMTKFAIHWSFMVAAI